ncbi:MAG: glycosyltransferase [Candidatus Kapaibacterium sp.]
MKIAYINKTRWLSNMPSTVFSFMNAYSFAQNGVETTAIFKHPKDVDMQSYEKYFGVEALDNFRVETFSDKYLLLRSNESFYIHVNNYLSKNKHDIVITRDPGYLPFLVRLKKKQGIKVFYQSHNFYADLSIRDDVQETNKAKYNRNENRFIPEIDGVLALNGPHKKLYEKYVKIPVFAGRPGLKEVHEARDNFDQKAILYSGSFQLKKGLDILIEALSIIKDEDFKLILAGGRNKDEIALVENLLAQKELEYKTEITGWLSYSKLEGYLNNATIGVIPLKDIFYNRYLTAPSKLFDYLSFGIPVVATKLPSVEDLIGHSGCGKLVEAGNPEALADSIMKILSSHELYNKYRECSIKKAEDYIWKKSGAKMLDFMEKA